MNAHIRKRNLIVLGFVAVVALSALGLWRSGYVQALERLQRQGFSDLALASDRLTAQLQRYRELAVFMSEHPTVTAVLNGGGAGPASDLFLDVADKTSALDVMLVDLSGRVRAAANGSVGLNLGETAYVRRAMQGALGTGHGIGTPLRGRAYYFATPIFGPSSGRVIGAVIVAADVNVLEADWRGSQPAVFLTDPQGVVFISNRSELLLWRRGPDGLLQTAERAGSAFSYSDAAGYDIWHQTWDPYLPRIGLLIQRPLPVIGFQGNALIDVAPAQRIAVLQAAAFAALCLAFGALLLVATERRRTLAQANALLEARVAERTAALVGTNAQLLREAAEREEAQAALARAQADLVQAGKLSALGQLSAGISHELNQPLMAIGSFAENGVTFLDKNRPDRARENLSRIGEMAQRMARIISNLRAFARQESSPSVRVDVCAVLRSAVEITGPRLREADVTATLDAPDTPVWVRGGDVRLGQVFVNLITNAVDAMEGRPERALHITVQDGAHPSVTVRDTGPGIDVPDQVFDPFYTTKSLGRAEGMGLGLSISYGIVQSFGGEIRGENTGEGAAFTVQLVPWDESEAA
ncbi:two-component system, NtrC family, C4-dicarboxylate transport sensor histidine kinase DctB [Pseudosulfitobacter pseudonitzschiae]|uniref:sensor histidine kinase n=1 Tax=Pseudosulfitobacter pseudonitzschiae TaxID=1402135 RepID=UPI000922DB0F|nr:ATP-binding protein [Pseudosulfitobacter pseudonitzschiae]QKS09094.1 sensor histidine kinase [Pseudosulfitobacter pseudonitzschiae]SHE56277.1 two-component system, NtrC family, C4-dicarboxylate transport sensor histidine kinase DctB [Pseudosulfitobacter pseudonitzschiae]